MNPRLAFELWLAIGAAAVVVAFVHAWAVVGLEATLEEIRRLGSLNLALSIALTLVAGPISMAWAAAYIVRKREERLEDEHEARAVQVVDMRALERELERSVERMAGCRHERTVKVDYGSGYFADVDKCIDCWAFRMPDGRWQANCSPPPRRG